MGEQGLEATLGPLGVLRMMCRCLLVAGSKSFTHMVVALERYHGPLAVLVQQLGLEVRGGAGWGGGGGGVKQACLVWVNPNPNLHPNPKPNPTPTPTPGACGKAKQL